MTEDLRKDRSFPSNNKSIMIAHQFQSRRGVALVTEVADHKIRVGEPLVELGFPASVVLFAFGQSVAEKDDCLALGRRGQRGGG